MKNKELILLVEELKQQVEECRDRDSSNYIDSLLKRTDWIIKQSKVNNGVLDDVSKQRELLKAFIDFYNYRNTGDKTIYNDEIEIFIDSL